MTAVRIGIVGARRRLQGIGGFVARDLAASGATVVAIVGTSVDTVDEARSALRSRYGLHVRGYLDLQEMISTEQIEAIAICSPYICHRQHLRMALDHKLHVLCEKPLVFEKGRDAMRDVKPLIEGFANVRRVLMVNEQWPHTLPFFRLCYPHVRLDQPPTQLEVLFCPTEEGIDMIPSAMPHVISLLLELAPLGGQLDRLSIELTRPTTLDISFVYVHSRGRTQVRAMLRNVSVQPRPAGYGINGHAVRRVIRLPSYDMLFEPVENGLEGAVAVQVQDTGQENAQKKQIPIDNPLRLLAIDFLSRVCNVNATLSMKRRLFEGVRLLDEIYSTAAQSIGGP